MTAYVSSRGELPLILQMNDATVQQARDLVLGWMTDGVVNSFNFDEAVLAVIVNWGRVVSVAFRDENPNDMEGSNGERRAPMPVFQMNLP